MYDRLIHFVLYYSPQFDVDAATKVLLFDSWYDKFRGAVTNIAVLDGTIKKGNMTMVTRKIGIINHVLSIVCCSVMLDFCSIFFYI